MVTICQKCAGPAAKIKDAVYVVCNACSWMVKVYDAAGKKGKRW